MLRDLQLTDASLYIVLGLRTKPQKSLGGVRIEVLEILMS